MLVIDNSPHGRQVPVQLGTLHIDMILQAAAQTPSATLGNSWEHARYEGNFVYVLQGNSTGCDLLGYFTFP